MSTATSVTDIQQNYLKSLEEMWEYITFRCGWMRIGGEIKPDSNNVFKKHESMSFYTLM